MRAAKPLNNCQVPSADGQLVVRKWAQCYGINANGAPWLRRQSLFVKKTGIFVQSTKVIGSGKDVTLELPYIASHSSGELVFANAGDEPVVNALITMLARMATSVWIEGQEQAGPRFIEKAHFERMRRRLKIARAQDEILDKILKQNSEIEPIVLTEIRGDLNIHNVLRRLNLDEDKDVALIDPRGVPLLGGDAHKKFEPGDYCYDISKLLFSLTGFSEIRKRYLEYSSSNDHRLKILRHPGSDTMNGAAARLIPAISSNQEMRRWIEKVERGGLRSFELRLNEAVALLSRKIPLSVKSPVLSLQFPPISESPDFRAAMIQRVLFRSYTSNEDLPYDVLELSVKAKAAPIALRRLREMVGLDLPEETGIYLSTDLADPTKVAKHFTYVLVHPSNGDIINDLKIVHISSTGSSSRSQFTARTNDRLLSPRSFGISPLQLAVLQANQLLFTKPGRWVVENDSFFLLS
ncbi:hypothetical protein MY11210_006102 [Beauveria gryllotalpidicola]